MSIPTRKGKPKEMDNEEKKGALAKKEEEASITTVDANNEEEDDGDEDDEEKGTVVLGPQVALKEQLEMDKVHNFFIILGWKTIPSTIDNSGQNVMSFVFVIMHLLATCKILRSDIELQIIREDSEKKLDHIVLKTRKIHSLIVNSIFLF